MLETAIKFYNVNKDSDSAVYMVFSSLATEKVFLPTNERGHLMSLRWGTDEVIPLFTSKDRVLPDEPIELIECFIAYYIEALLNAEKHLMINPFSEKNLQFVVPYEAIKRFLIPVIQEQKK